MIEQPFRFEPLAIAGLWSIQPDRTRSLQHVARALLPDAQDPDGVTVIDNGSRLLRAWPHQAWLLSDQPQPPGASEAFSDLMTDISDAYCAFRLAGESAFAFIGDYLSTDIHRPPGEQACLHCRLGHYRVLLWWQRQDAIQILVERSLAQSFAEHVGRLLEARNRVAS